MSKQKLPRGIRARGQSFIVDVTVKDAGRRTATCASLGEAITTQALLKAELLKESQLNKGVKVAEPKQPKHKFSMTLGEATKKVFSLPAPQGWAGAKSHRICKINSDAALEYFGADTLLVTITTSKIDGYIAHLAKQGASNGTINRKLAALSKVMSVAAQRADGDYHKPHFPTRLREAKGRVRQISPDEEKKILEYCRLMGMVDMSDAIQVLIDTGMRVGELISLEDEDVSLSERLILIYGTDGNGTKNGEFRSVPATSRVLEILKRRKFSHGKRLFPMTGAMISDGWRKIRTYMDMDDDPQFIPHTLRHTCASRLIQRRVSLKVVQEWMGHKTIQMTQRYAHLYPQDLMQARDALEQPLATIPATNCE